MAKKNITKEYLEIFTEGLKNRLLGKPKGIGDDIKRYADNKISNPRFTHMFIANDKISLAFYYKMLAFNSIISSAKFGLGIDYSIDDVKDIFEKEKEIQKKIDEFIDYAYSKGIGNKKQIERWKKIKQESEAGVENTVTETENIE